MKFYIIQGHRGEYPIDLMCRMFDVSKSGYYAWKKSYKKREVKSSAEQKLVRTIEAVHLGSNKNYGSPRVHGVISGLVDDVSESKVARLMRKNKIKSRLKRKFKSTTDSNHKLPVAPNHLMQDFTAYVPNQIWMSDLTYIKTSEGWLYVCAIIDLFSRKVVGWSASSRMTKEIVMAAYLRARRLRRPGPGLIFHSDRGSQFAALKFAAMLRKHKVIQSMSRKGNCWDSAPIESLWHTLKTEWIYWNCYATREDAFYSVKHWIEKEYNKVRAHSSLNNLSPDVFERKEVTLAAKLM